MKKQYIILIVVIALTGSVPVSAQVQEKKTEEPKKEEVRKEFRDLNANGIDDAEEFQKRNGQQKKMRNRDKFIDTDGDGICDGRASGAGLKIRMHGKNTAKQPQKGKK
ncbi:MAG: hypothetical protein WCT99_12115 [Bacteroidota bacterium]|jgi:hypothetical protein